MQRDSTTFEDGTTLDEISKVTSSTAQCTVPTLADKSQSISLPDSSSPCASVDDNGVIAQYQRFEELLKRYLNWVELADPGSIVTTLQRVAWIAFLGDSYSFSDREAQTALKSESHLLAAWEFLRPLAMKQMLHHILSCKSEGETWHFHFANWNVQAFLCAGYLACGISDKVPGLNFVDLIFDEKWCDVLAFRFAHQVPEISLHLVGRCVGFPLVRQLSRFLPESRCVVKVDLSCNQMGPQEVKVLMDSLKSNGTLRWLLLGSNLFGDEGAAHVAQCLSTVSSLKGLSLRSCRIREKGATSIAAVLAKGTRLEHLCLAANRIGDWGAEELAMALPGTKLRSLDLSNCTIGRRGAQQLGKGIKLAPTLENVDLAGNDVSEPGADCLVGSMYCHRGLKHMSLEFADAHRKVKQNVIRSGHRDGLELVAEMPNTAREHSQGPGNSRMKQLHSSLHSERRTGGAERRPASVQGFRSPKVMTKLTFCRPASQQEARIAEDRMLAQVTAEEEAANEAAALRAEEAARLQDVEEEEAQNRIRKAARNKTNNQVADVHQKMLTVPWLTPLPHLDKVWVPGGGGNPLSIVWSYRLNSIDKTVSEDVPSGSEPPIGEQKDSKTRYGSESPTGEQKDAKRWQTEIVQGVLDGRHDRFCVRMDLKETLSRQTGQSEAEAKLYWEAIVRKQRILDERKATASKLAIAGRVAKPRKRQPATAR